MEVFHHLGAHQSINSGRSCGNTKEQCVNSAWAK